MNTLRSRLTDTQLLLRGTLALLLVTLVACAGPKPQLEEGASGPASEPVQLAELDKLTGVWDGTALAKLLETGEEFETRSIHRVQWEAGGHFLIERTATSTGGAEPTTSIGVWTWDEREENYRCWRFDSRGAVHERRMSWDEEAEQWVLSMTSNMRGETESYTATGTLTFPTPDERVYHWTRYRPGSEEPWVTIDGTSKRVELAE